MFQAGNRLIAAAVVVTFAALFVGIGVRLSTADEPKAPSLSDLRDAVKAAGKRGENVDEIRKTLDALEKMLTRGWTAPEPGKTVEPPAELVALRDAVDNAAKKGENVDEIRQQLEIVEKGMTGRVLTKPKPVPVPIEPPPLPNPNQLNPGFPQPFGPLGPGAFPNFPGPQLIPGGQIDNESIQKGQELIVKAMDLLQKNPNDPEAMKLLKQGQDQMMKGMLGGLGGRGMLINPGLNLPNPIGRAQERFRLGVRLERVSELAADQLGLEVARGVGISAVIDGSAADKAGFKPYDIVLEFAGKPVTDSPEDFTRLVSDTKAGEKVTAVVMRKGKRVELKDIELPDAAREFPQPVPFPARPGRPGGLRPIGPMGPGGLLPDLGPLPGGPGLRAVPARGGFNSVSFSVNNGQLTINASQDGVQYKITGTRNGDETEVTKVTITDGDKTTEYEKVDKVPEQYRSTVEKLIQGSQTRRRK